MIRKEVGGLHRLGTGDSGGGGEVESQASLSSNQLPKIMLLRG